MLPQTIFWVPFKSGCSVDVKTARSNCPSKALNKDLDVQNFLHSLGLMYSLREMANLMKGPSKSVYQMPEIFISPHDALVDVDISGEWFFSIFEPITKIWKLFSPNIWTALYTLALAILIIRISYFLTKAIRRNRLSRLKNKIKEIEERKLEEHLVSYDEMRPSYVSPFIDPHGSSIS